MCSRPRKPQRKPKPRAAEDSGSKDRGGVVELELLQRGAQVFVLVGLHGVDAREDHRLHVLEARDGFLCRGAVTEVIVSPTFTSDEVLMPEQM